MHTLWANETHFQISWAFFNTWSANCNTRLALEKLFQNMEENCCKCCRRYGKRKPYTDSSWSKAGPGFMLIHDLKVLFLLTHHLVPAPWIPSAPPYWRMTPHRGCVASENFGLFSLLCVDTSWQNTKKQNLSICKLQGMNYHHKIRLQSSLESKSKQDSCVWPVTKDSIWHLGLKVQGMNYHHKIRLQSSF